MADPGNTFDLRTTEVDVWELQLDANSSPFPIKIGGYLSIRTNATRAACYLEGNPETMYDFYFVTQDCNTNFSMNKDLKLVGAQYDLRPFPQATSAFLEDSQPDTTLGSTQFTTGISKTYSGSFGFFGDTPQGNVSASVTYSESKTISIPDVQISKLSNDNGANAKWHYALNKDAPIASSELSVFNSALWKVTDNPAAGNGFPFSTVLTLEFYGPASLLVAAVETIGLHISQTMRQGIGVHFDPDLPDVAAQLRRNPMMSSMADAIMQQPCTVYITLPAHVVILPMPKPAPKPKS